MITKPLAGVTEADLAALITNAVAEGKTIDYKAAMPSNTDGDKKEFLADVSSFSNTAGGDLIFGMNENQGLPTSIVGIVTADMDLELRRLDSIIASGLEPRIRYETRVVECANGARVLIIRTEKSWAGPHRVVFKGHDKFYGRNSAGKYPLDVAELRTAFTLSATVAERISDFRTDRIIALSNNRTPIPFMRDPKIVLHCMPIESFASRPQYDVLRYDREPRQLQPIYSGTSSGWSRRINLAGVISYTSGDVASSYTQVYRNGIIEAVTGALLALEHNGRMLIPSIAYEREILDYLPTCFRILNELGCTPPVVVALTLTNVKGLRMGVGSRSRGESGNPIDEDTLILPEVVVEDFATLVNQILKPVFDLIWNACGYSGSRNFDADGNWVDRR